MTAGAQRWPQALLAAALASWGLVPAECAAQSLYVVPTESHGAPVDEAQPLRVLLHSRSPVELAKVLGVEAPAAGTDTLTFVLDGYTVIHGIPERSWLDATFVLDYRDSNVAQLSAEFEQRLGRKPAADAETRAALVEFVATTVKPSLDREFDIASEVATRREGDCTEHAVLAAALARGAGIPARVVLGLALIHDARHYGSYGHAWAELRIDGRWVVADAVLRKQKFPVRYLPFGVLENEGMGFMLDVARLTPVWVQRVEVLGAVVTKQ